MEFYGIQFHKIPYNFLLQQNIVQSLAGRVGYLTLMPFSVAELQSVKLLPNSDYELMLQGFYPPVYDQKIPFADWTPNYIHTYIEKDVRQIKNVTDLIVFEWFMRLLAGRNGQELNMNALAVDVGVDTKTIQAWLGILESSFIIYLLRAHYKNYRKTIVKRPKIYLTDISLVCNLLGIHTDTHLSTHPLRGALFEGMVLIELLKQRTNLGLESNLFFWRDKTGHEIDIVLDNGTDLLFIEIKSGKTISSEYFKNLNYWLKLSDQKQGFVLYAGDQNQQRSDGIGIMNWKQFILRESEDLLT